MAELLFWPALLAYGEAAVAYAGDVRRPGSLGRLATWGVRVGWLVQTALLVAQAVRADGFPWDTWAGMLNLFVWFVVGAYLIWGCRPRFRLLGLVVMPLAALLLAVSYAAGGVDASGESGYSTLFLVLHVGLVLAGFAGFTLAAALAALYLWQERELKHRSSTLLRFRAPSLVTLESLAARTVAFALPVLTLGMAAGFARVRHGSDLDPLIVLTAVDVDGLRRVPAASLRSGLARPTRRLRDARRLRARRRPPGEPANGAFRMSLVLVGTSHRLAPVEDRERVAVDLEAAAELAASLADRGEAVCLSTCNRTELYLVQGDPDEAEASAIAALGAGEIELYRLRDEDAALHLFRVAAGLDSLVPGEGEILGQVRSAYEAGSCGPVLDRLFRQALHAGKKVRTETAIAESPSSVSSAAAALAQQVFGELDGCRVLLIGAGEVSELAARSLAKRGASISAVTSRTHERAVQLAERFGGRAIPFEQLSDELERADVVVSSTSSADQVVSRDQVPDRKGRPLFVIDLAVPRDVDPGRGGARRLLSVRHRRSGGSREREHEREMARSGAGGVDHRAGGEAVPRLAELPRRRSSDRIASRTGRDDPLGRAGEGRESPRGPLRERAAHRRVPDDADRQQAPARPDRADEGGRGDRGHGVRRGRRHLFGLAEEDETK